MWLQKDPRANNFDLMRFVMAVLVIFSHSFSLLSGLRFDTEPLRSFNGNKLSLGELAVDVFFIMSGFLITMSWTRSKSAWSFATKRAARILPGYVLAFIVSAFVIAPWFTSAHYLTSPSFYPSFMKSLARFDPFIVPGVFPHNPYSGILNASPWTIPYELGCYAGILVLGILGLIRWRIFVLILFVFLLLLANGCLNHVIHSPVDTSGDLLRFANLFLGGAVFYLFREKIPCKDWMPASCAVAVLFTCITGALIGIVLPICLTYFVLWAALQPHLRFDRFARYGDFSYGIYLYAFPIQQGLIALFGPHLSALTLFLSATALSFAAGFLSWHLVEKWFLSVRRVREHAGSEAPRAASPEPVVAGA
jgi:peptidoglycan/LPS O-acetylase OafA/YrhL